MNWEIEYTNEFADWWDELSGEEQESIAGTVLLLQESGPFLSRPYSDTVRGSRHKKYERTADSAPGRSLQNFIGIRSSKNDYFAT